jgi:hypothetical protein
MSPKRKNLLIITITIIAACYGIAFNSIINHSDYPSNTIKVQSNMYKGKQLPNDDSPPSKYKGNQLPNDDSPPSKYKGNQLPNGASPFDACFGKGYYNGNATLTIKNGASSDAIVCLYSISRGQTIRNEYVCKNSSFTMDNISQGSYKIRVFYGNDWNPELENPCGEKGYFESDVYFSEFDETKYFEDNNDGYTVATVTLYTVTGGNASTSRINQSDFFNN